MSMSYEELMLKPALIGIVADVNSGKSNLIYNMLDDLSKRNTFKLYTFGLKYDIAGATKIQSVNELERVKNALVVADEFFRLFDLDNRKQKKIIECALRLIHHNNNVLVLAGLPENFKKFISAKIDHWLLKKCSLADFINGSRVKNIVMDYKGEELGSTVLNLDKDEVIYFDGLHYHKERVPYMEKYDSKKGNESVLKKVQKVSQVMCKKGELKSE